MAEDSPSSNVYTRAAKSLKNGFATESSVPGLEGGFRLCLLQEYTVLGRATGASAEELSPQARSKMDFGGSDFSAHEQNRCRPKANRMRGMVAPTRKRIRAA